MTDNQAAFIQAVNDLRAGTTTDAIDRMAANYGNIQYRFPDLQSLHDTAAASRGPFVEVGSGLTTVVLGVVAEKLGTSVVAVESSTQWAASTQAVLDMCNISTVTIWTDDLRAYIATLKDELPFVLIDGPDDLTLRARSIYWLGDYMRNATVVTSSVANDVTNNELTLWADRHGRSITQGANAALISTPNQ